MVIRLAPFIPVVIGGANGLSVQETKFYKYEALSSE